MCISENLLRELEDVLRREKFRVRLELSGHSAGEIVAKLRAAAVVVGEAVISIPPNLRDPDDVHVLACAAAIAADAIVSGDNDLLAMESFAGIPIVTVRQALERCGVQPE